MQYSRNRRVFNRFQNMHIKIPQKNHSRYGTTIDLQRKVGIDTKTKAIERKVTT